MTRTIPQPISHLSLIHQQYKKYHSITILGLKETYMIKYLGQIQYVFPSDTSPGLSLEFYFEICVKLIGCDKWLNSTVNSDDSTDQSTVKL